MYKEEKELIQKFDEISKKGWIESNCNHHGSVGLTFEKELRKKADSLYFPDFYDIEIKCTTVNSHYHLFLFTIAFDGPSFPEIERIVDTYGYPDKDFPDKKVIFENINCVTKHLVNKKYKFRLKVDRESEKLFLCVFDKEENLIEEKSFVYLESIKNHLMLKLQKLALVYANQKVEKGKKYFQYNQLMLYHLTDFETFLVLLEKGLIDVSIISRISKSGENRGKYANKNLVFTIKKHRIKKLFQLIYDSNELH